MDGQEEPIQNFAGVPAIKKLDESVVNRIAAGEVIQRPSSALKEMLENSLDAGSTSITVTVKDGGNKLLQIQDNGHGIRREDLPILCERFTTSKLKAFEDLMGIQTLGFRGEALASISYVAHMTVTTMTEDSTVAYRATYSDGVMDEGCPRPCASTKGTIILVEDLFYNVPLRKKGLKGSSEEYNQVLDVMGRYAVFKAGVAFTCKRQGEARADLHTLPGGSRLDAIRAVYGASAARNALPLSLKREAAAAEGGRELDSDALSFEVQGYVSGADYSGKKTTLVLFINGRSVECTPLKRALEATYATILPKAAKPFLFLDIRLPGSHVDVNVHPTKKEVGFLHQEELIEAVREGVEERLLSSNGRRTFTQMHLPGAPLLEVPTNTPPPTYYRPDKLVRTDAKSQTLHAFMPAHLVTQQGADGGPSAEAQHAQQGGPGAEAQQAEQGGGVGRGGRGGGAGAFDFMPTPLEIAGGVAAAAPPPEDTPEGADTPGAEAGPGAGTPGEGEEVEEGRGGEEGGEGTQLGVGSRAARGLVRHRSNPSGAGGMASVQGLLAEAEKRPHPGLSEILQNLTFVGMADQRYALIQHGTRLYLADLQTLSQDMFYQQALRRVGHCRRIRLEPPPSVADLAVVEMDMLQAAGRWQEAEMGGSKEEVAQLLSQLLRKKADWLGRHFSIDVDTEGRLCSLPQLIEQWTPDMCRLPAFVLALAQKVEWGEEERCFRSLAMALADLYAVHPLLPPSSPGEAEGEGGLDQASRGGESQEEGERRAREWSVQHVILPALRLFLKPGRHRAGDGSLVELTRLETLYRIFERC